MPTIAIRDLARVIAQIWEARLALDDASTVKGADHRLADEDAAEQGTGNAAPDHIAGNGALAGFHLSREAAVFGEMPALRLWNADIIGIALGMMWRRNQADLLGRPEAIAAPRSTNKSAGRAR